MRAFSDFGIENWRRVTVIEAKDLKYIKERMASVIGCEIKDAK